MELAPLNRIASLPRRVWRDRAAAAVPALTAALRQPSGTQTLFPIQAVTLLELWDQGGCFCNARVGAGKAQPTDEPVLTPSGWVEIGKLRAGDLVCGADGQPKRVLSVHPQGVRTVARVKFSDGSWTRCDWDHLWTARDAHGVTHTRTLRAWQHYGFDRKCGEHRAHKVFIPLAAPIQAPTALVPVDPYTLGALLGDGCITQVTPSFTSMDRDIVERMQLPAGVTFKATACQNSGRATQYNLTQAPGKRGPSWPNPLTVALRKLGLMGCGSSSKFVPDVYRRASSTQRAELLAGLLDTDATTPQAGGWIEYSTLSTQLALDVVDIVQSLGGTCTVGLDSANGNARLGIKMPVNPFRCGRKASVWKNGQRGPLRAMVSAIDDGCAECVCINVDAPDHLYVTRNHILTHNTLVSGLAPHLMAAKGFTRPLITVPANLLDKTVNELAAAREHWQVAHQYALKTYTLLSQTSHERFLDEYQPDGLVFDEPEWLRTILKPGGGRQRVKRYIIDRRAKGLPLWCLFLTGTPDRDAITDYAHMVHWALGDGAPFPTAGPDLEWQELASWSAWLDKGEACEAGAFRKYFPVSRGLDQDSLDTAAALARDNDLYCDRLIHTPGIIVSDDEYEGAELRVAVYYHDPNLNREFELLRDLQMRPDGWDLINERPRRAGADGALVDEADDVNTFSVWGVARQLALGFYYKPDPEPPAEWLSARKAWARYVRQLIEAPNSRYDTAKQVWNACERAAENGRTVPEWARWAQLEATFTPGKVPVWLSDHAIEACVSWGNAHPGLIWTDHVAFAHRLSTRTGWTYYGQKGQSSSGRSVESEDGKRTVIVSRRANHKGRNLQFAFHRSLITAMPNAAADIEQLLGRTHRFGQTSPVVYADILCTCAEHVRALDRVEDRARTSQRQTRLKQKWLSVELKQHGSAPAESRAFG